MALWRAIAIEHLPELRQIIASAESIMSLWIELNFEFEKAYREPRNDDLIARIYGFADWCIKAASGNDAGHDPATAVMLAFYEHVPTCKQAREDMPRWFPYRAVANNKAVFSHLIGEEAYVDLLAFMHKHRNRYVARKPSEKP